MAPFDSSMGPDQRLIEPARANPVVFKEALARLAGGLAIISYWDGDRPGGVLVSSITGLSVDPPRFLFCIQKTSSSHNALLRSQACGVTVLSMADEHEARTFMDPSLRSHRFKSERWRLFAPKPPTLDGALSSSACTISTRVDCGSHTIVVVTADNVEVSDGRPLLFFNRSVRELLG